VPFPGMMGAFGASGAAGSTTVALAPAS